MPELLPLRRGDREPFLENARLRGRPLIGVGVHDAMGAQNAARTNFDLVWLSSLEVSATKALPDKNLINAVHMASLVSEIADRCDLPILVDGDNGYGSDDTAALAARQFAGAGATGVSFEDSAFPKTNSLVPLAERPLVEADVFAARLRHIADELERRHQTIELIARTEALVAGLGPDAALDRCRLYREAGAAGFFIQCNRNSVDDFVAVLPEIAKLGPVVIAPTQLDYLHERDFQELGADVILYANVGVRCRAHAELEVFSKLRQAGRLAEVGDVLMPVAELIELATVAPFSASREELAS